jgi:hypothetical protein
MARVAAATSAVPPSSACVAPRASGTAMNVRL